MKLGICTSDLSPQTLGSLFKKIHDYGFTTMQFNFRSIGQEEMPSTIGDELIDQIKLEAASNQLAITAINGTFNMAQSDFAARSENIRRFSILVDACKKLGCNLITLCTGTRNSQSMWKWHPNNSTPEAWNDVLGTMKIVAAIAEKAGIILGIEIEASNVVDTPTKARKMIDEAGFGNIKIIMDCANLFLPGTAHPENVHSTIQGAFDHSGDDVILAHGKDIMESEDISFCATGQGIVDYDYFIECLKKCNYSGDMILHGIYDETKFVPCIEFITHKLHHHGIVMD